MSVAVTLLLILLAYMVVWFVISIIQKRNDLADIAWGGGFVLLAWSAYFLSDNPGTRGLFINALVTIWGLRLAWHIGRRNMGKHEDYRYQAWRQAWGKWFYLRSFFQVYMLQGLLLAIISLPVYFIHQMPASDLTVMDGIGLGIWLIGMLFESIADHQLAAFKKNPENKGKLLQSGLWAYSRHPNYFGEVLLWWGIWIITLNNPEGWWTIIGPLTITFLILKVSGIPLLEEKMVNHPDFEAYRKRVPMFLPKLR